ASAPSVWPRSVPGARLLVRHAGQRTGAYGNGRRTRRRHPRGCPWRLTQKVRLDANSRSLCFGYRDGSSLRPATPSARLTPTCPPTESGGGVIVLLDPPISKFAPTPTPTETSPLAPT